jgi:hypothetical protein
LFVATQPDRDPAKPSEEIHVPGPIRPEAFREDIAAYRRQYLGQPESARPTSSLWYGPGGSFQIWKGGAALSPAVLMCKDLQDWERPPAGRVAVDVYLGRISFAAGEEPEVVASSFAYGFSADIGGGAYDRRASLEAHARAIIQHAGGAGVWSIEVSQSATDSPATLQEALDAWESAGRPAGIIVVADNAVYLGDLTVDLPANGWLVIEAAAEKRPIVEGSIEVLAPEAGARLVLDGIVVEGAVFLEGDLALDLSHCTIVPGRRLDDSGLPAPPEDDGGPDPDPGLVDSIVADAGPGQTPEVTIASSITGSIRLPDSSRGLTVRDSIVQAFAWEGRAGGPPRAAIAAVDPDTDAGPPTSLERVTVFGPVLVRELTLASEVVFTDLVQARRRQVGCVRFSYVPEGSRTPPRYRCQPDLALEEATEAEASRIRACLVPAFTSTRYGDPGFAQLRLSSALEIRTGGESGSEMGAFSGLRMPQREANLRTRLGEYLPFGLKAALIYVT